MVNTSTINSEKKTIFKKKRTPFANSVQKIATNLKKKPGKFLVIGAVTTIAVLFRSPKAALSVAFDILNF